MLPPSATHRSVGKRVENRKLQAEANASEGTKPVLQSGSVREKHTETHTSPPNLLIVSRALK